MPWTLHGPLLSSRCCGLRVSGLGLQGILIRAGFLLLGTSAFRVQGFKGSSLGFRVSADGGLVYTVETLQVWGFWMLSLSSGPQSLTSTRTPVTDTHSQPRHTLILLLLLLLLTATATATATEDRRRLRTTTSYYQY